MAMLPAIMSLFGRTDPAGTAPLTNPNPAAQNGTQPGTPVGAAGNTTIPNGTQPGSDGTVAAFPVTPTGAASPLENFKDVWNAPDKSPTPANLIPALNLDPTKLMEMAGKIDFVGHIPDADITAAMTDPAAMRAMMNKVAQYGFANAVQANGQIVQNSLGSAQGVLKDQILPSAFRDQQVTQALADNPVFQNPAVAPMVDSIKQQLMAKYPTAPAHEIAQKATEYMQGLSTMIVSATGSQILSPQDQARSRGPLSRGKDTDWETLLG